MYSEAVVYARELDRNGIKHDNIFTLPNGDYDVETRWNLSNSNAAASIRAIFDHDNHTVAIRCFSFVKVPDNRLGALYLACNRLNMDYRWVKFIIDKDNDVNIEADLYVDDNTAGREVYRLMRRMVNIADDAYGILMKALWS